MNQGNVQVKKWSFFFFFFHVDKQDISKFHQYVQLIEENKQKSTR